MHNSFELNDLYDLYNLYDLCNLTYLTDVGFKKTHLIRY